MTPTIRLIILLVLLTLPARVLADEIFARTPGDTYMDIVVEPSATFPPPPYDAVCDKSFAPKILFTTSAREFPNLTLQQFVDIVCITNTIPKKPSLFTLALFYAPTPQIIDNGPTYTLVWAESSLIPDFSPVWTPVGVPFGVTVPKGL